MGDRVRRAAPAYGLASVPFPPPRMIEFKQPVLTAMVIEQVMHALHILTRAEGEEGGEPQRMGAPFVRPTREGWHGARFYFTAVDNERTVWSLYMVLRMYRVKAVSFVYAPPAVLTYFLHSNNFDQHGIPFPSFEFIELAAPLTNDNREIFLPNLAPGILLWYDTFVPAVGTVRPQPGNSVSEADTIRAAAAFSYKAMLFVKPPRTGRQNVAAFLNLRMVRAIRFDTIDVNASFAQDYEPAWLWNSIFPQFGMTRALDMYRCTLRNLPPVIFDGPLTRLYCESCLVDYTFGALMMAAQQVELIETAGVDLDAVLRFARYQSSPAIIPWQSLRIIRCAASSGAKAEAYAQKNIVLMPRLERLELGLSLEPSFRNSDMVFGLANCLMPALDSLVVFIDDEYSSRDSANNLANSIFVLATTRGSPGHMLREFRFRGSAMVFQIPAVAQLVRELKQHAATIAGNLFDVNIAG